MPYRPGPKGPVTFLSIGTRFYFIISLCSRSVSSIQYFFSSSSTISARYNAPLDRTYMARHAHIIPDGTGSQGGRRLDVVLGKVTGYVGTRYGGNDNKLTLFNRD